MQKLRRLKRRNRVKNKRYSLQQLEESFANGDITLVQFIEVIIDNFGKVHGKEIRRCKRSPSGFCQKRRAQIHARHDGNDIERRAYRRDDKRAYKEDA